MASGRDDRHGSRGASCAGCGAPFAGDQRYCLDCGARRGELPPAVAAQIAAFRDRDRGKGAAPAPASGGAGTAGAASAAATGAEAARERAFARFIPSPRAAAVAVMCMLALGVIVGSATSQLAQSAGLQTIVLEIAERKAPPPEPEPEVAAAPPAEPEEIAAAPVEEAPLPTPIPAEPLPEEPLPEEPLPEEPIEEVIPPELEEEGLPEVKHLFVIMLGENGYEEAFGKASSAPYLAKTLPEQGELLRNYYAVSKGELANQAALLSGQGPTEELSAECPSPTPLDITPGTVRPDTAQTTKQVEGNGCVFPAPVETLPGQLAAKKLKWKAYVEEAVPGTPEPPSCVRPFALFHSLLDKPECLASSAGLPQLKTDLEDPKKTPTFSYIVPNKCHAGAIEPCEPGQPTGPAAAEPFLEEVVPEIVNSKAYAEGGLLLITSAEAPQTGAAADSSSCCGAPAQPFPNLAPPPEEAPASDGTKKAGGGGKVGLLLLSSFVKPGTVNETTFANHFTLLLTIEELFELEKLGYANEPVLLPFDATVFNYAAEEESTSATETEGESTGPTGAAKGPAGASSLSRLIHALR